MRVLIACEFSGIVRDVFAKRGHDAWSCDLLPSEQPGVHYQGDVKDIIGDGWDLLIAHPPCTFLCNSGVRWLSANGEIDRELEKVGQGQLVMLIPKAGEAVERSLPHYMPNDLGYAQKHDDEALAHELRASIDQRVQAQKEIQAQIEVLARKGMAIEAEEMELRRKLKEVYTEPLNFA